jgi:hypothetical protein
MIRNFRIFYWRLRLRMAGFSCVGEIPDGKREVWMSADNKHAPWLPCKSHLGGVDWSEINRGFSDLGVSAQRLSETIKTAFHAFPKAEDFNRVLNKPTPPPPCPVVEELEREVVLTSSLVDSTEVYGLETVGDVFGWLEVINGKTSDERETSFAPVGRQAGLDVFEVIVFDDLEARFDTLADSARTEVFGLSDLLEWENEEGSKV